MNKQSYDAVMYSAFFDELEKLGFDVSGIDKEAVIGAGLLRAGKAGIGKAVSALTPASVKAQRALANPAMTSVGASPSKLISMGRQAQLAPSAASAVASTPGAQIARAGRAQRLQQARSSMNRTVGSSSW